MHAPPEQPTGNAPDWTRTRPIDASYWVRPGRLLVGEHPGSRSRGKSKERLRRFLEAGITCFIDLTEANEIAGYATLLPFEAPSGRRVEYLREPITDHGVPGDRETMTRIVALIDGALEAGHCVYLHCRAGIGRSATAAGCWLAEHSAGGGESALLELAELWQQSARSHHWPVVPETEAQAAYVRSWPARSVGVTGTGPRTRRTRQSLAPILSAASGIDARQRVRGAWFGLALGDALGRADVAGGAAGQWSQPTALALCLADSLAAAGGCDARDQIERYWLWFKQGHRAAAGEPGEIVATADVAKALATWRWRGQPQAGPHDPKDTAPHSLPRVLAAVLHAGPDLAGGIALGAECSRTTHQSPQILECCRLYAAMLASALHGRPAQSVLQGVPEPAPGCYGARPLGKSARRACTLPPAGNAAALPEVLRTIVLARRVISNATRFDEAIIEARRYAGDPASPLPAMVGTLFGALHGFDALPVAAIGHLAGREALDEISNRSLARFVAGEGAR